MSDMSFTLDDLSSTSALAQKASNNFYKNLPDGKPLTTTYSTDGDPNRTLTQRDLQGVLSGDALYRNPNFSFQVTNKNVQSSINRNTWRYRRP